MHLIQWMEKDDEVKRDSLRTGTLGDQPSDSEDGTNAKYHSQFDKHNLH